MSGYPSFSGFAPRGAPQFAQGGAGAGGFQGFFQQQQQQQRPRKSSRRAYFAGNGNARFDGGQMGPAGVGAVGPYGPPPVGGPAGPYGAPFGGPPAAAPGCGMWSADCGQCDVPATRYYVSSASIPAANGFVARDVRYSLCAKLWPFPSEYYYEQGPSCSGGSSSSSSCSEDEHRSGSSGADCNRSCNSKGCCRPRSNRRAKSDFDCCTGRQGYGDAEISLTVDKCTNTATVSGKINYFKLSSEVIGVEIMGPSDPARHDLCGSVLIDVGKIYKVSNNCQLGCFVTFQAVISCREAVNMLRGAYFINVRTCKYRSGEVKGRIMPGNECCDF